MLHPFHLWVSYHRFLCCQIKPIPYVSYMTRMWPPSELWGLGGFCDFENHSVNKTFHFFKYSPFLERLCNSMKMSLLGLRTKKSEAVLCSLEKSMKGTFISPLKRGLVTSLQHQVSWPYLMGIRDSLLLWSCHGLGRHEERMSESVVGQFILRIPCSDLFYVVWIKIRENLGNWQSLIYLCLIPL